MAGDEIDSVRLFVAAAMNLPTGTSENFPRVQIEFAKLVQLIARNHAVVPVCEQAVQNKYATGRTTMIVYGTLLPASPADQVDLEMGRLVQGLKPEPVGIEGDIFPPLLAREPQARCEV